MSTPGYDDRQEEHDAEYLKAWKDAPAGFLKSVEESGMKAGAHIDEEADAMEYQENFSSCSYTPDMGNLIDTETDRLVEKYGIQHEPMIREIVATMEAPMNAKIEQSRALMLGRVAGYLVKGEAQNVLARVHGLLHAVPGLAAANGVKSMRESARECKVSAQWIKLRRDKWCFVLGIMVPPDGTKSEEAKLKYRAAAQLNHWRTQKISGRTRQLINRPCHKIQKIPLALNSTASPSPTPAAT